MYSSSGGSSVGNRRGLARRAPIALIAALALIASLALGVGTASAAVEPKVTIEPAEGEYTTARLEFKTESSNPGAYAVQYTTNLGTEVKDEEWVIGNGQIYGAFSTYIDVGNQTVIEEITELKPDTKYQFRFIFLVYTDEYPAFTYPKTPEPGPFFKTKPVAKPVVALDPITDVTLNSGHIQGTIETNAPPGPLTAAQKAAYRTVWQLKCRPDCQFGTGASSGVVEGDEAAQSFTWDAIRLEANTYYEVELSATNAGGHQTTITEEFFTTPNIAPKLNPAPGGSSGKGAYSIGGVVTPYNTKITDCHFEYGPTTEYVYSAPCSPQPIGRNEVQRLIVGGAEGDFKMVFRGQTTGDIPLGADPKFVEEELQALSAIGPEGVDKVTREFGFFFVEYLIYFSGPLSGTNLGPIKGIQGTKQLRTGETGENVGPPGFAYSIVEGGNNDPVVVEADLTGLTPGATYHYKVFATNNVGTVTTEDIRFVAPLDPADKPCPNEAVRIENNSTRLPECRAYELVTTAFKASSGAGMGQMSVNPGTVSYTSRAGNIANSGYGGLFTNNYIAVRHEDGWQTVSNLNGPRGSFFAPPNSITGGSLGAAQYSNDLMRSIWFLNKPGERLSLWLRQDDGTFTRVHEPPEQPGFFGVTFLFYGASDDLSHVFYAGNEFGGDMWAPGVGPGIYEFVGTGNGHVPQRIDIDNSGNPIAACIGGAVLTGSAFINRFTPDGRTIAFTVGECEGKTDQVWVRVDSSKSYFASASQCTRTAGNPGGACNAPSNPEFQGLSRDGSHVLFSTVQQLLNSDTDNTRDLYSYVLPTTSDPNPSPNLIQISGVAPNAKVMRMSRVSNDGHRVYFLAQGVLASNHDAHDQPPFPGDANVYVWEQNAAHPEGETKFVMRLEDPPQNYDLILFSPEISADGRYMVFQAYHPMVETDTDNSKDIYRYDAVTGEMTRVTVDVAGVGGNADFTDAGNYLFTGGVLSNDGQQVVFTTNEALSPDDGNGGPDAYIWQEGHTSLLSTGAVGGGAGAVVIDGSGDNIYITSGQSLTADDIDDVSDVYDIRRGGGFSFKELPPCVGEGCQPAGTPAPDNGLDNGASGTDVAAGDDNYRPPTVSIKAMSPSQRAKLAAGGEAELSLKVSGPGKVALRGTARIGKRSSKVIAASSRAVQPGVVNVPITLSDGGLSQLRKRGVLSVQLAAEVADSETATATLKLKTAEARRKRSKKGNG